MTKWETPLTDQLLAKMFRVAPRRNLDYMRTPSNFARPWAQISDIRTSQQNVI